MTRKIFLLVLLFLHFAGCSEKKTEPAPPAPAAAPQVPTEAPPPLPPPPPPPPPPTPESRPESRPESQPAAPPAAATAPKEAILQTFRAFLELKSFRAVMEMKSDRGDAQTTMEFVSPDRYRIVSNHTMGGKAGQQQTLLIGAQTFMKVDASPWQKLPVNVGGAVQAFRDPKMIEDLQKSATAQYVGEATLDGQPMQVFTYQTDNAMGMKVKSNSKMWVSPADHLPRRIESEGEYAGMRSRTTITYSNFNADLKIEPPL